MLNLLKFDVKRIKQCVISVAFKTPLKIRLGICIYKTSLLHRPDEYIGFTPSYPPNILQQKCAPDAEIRWVNGHWLISA